MKYLKLFMNDSDYESFKDSELYIQPNVSSIITSKKVFFDQGALAEIEFFIDSSSGWVLPMGVTSFKAKEGMTWGEWVESEYNTYGFFTLGEDSSVHILDEPGGAWNYGYELISGAYPSEKITPDYTYTTLWESSPGFWPSN